MKFLDTPDLVRAALSPIRRSLLEMLQDPSSASRLAEELSVPRQRVNYHLKELENAGLVELVEERQRRGFTERVFRATHASLVVDPAVVSSAVEEFQDNYASEHLVDVAAGTVRDVARMQSEAEKAGQRLLTFTIETEVRFAEPGDLSRFAEALTDAVRQTVEAFDAVDGRPYRLVAGAHPAPRARRDEGVSDV
ncbi:MULTISPECIES: helix-turn-helix domain-containing protein [unclassified Microbacterium]|uniref:helix-turn-helix domain-containing protein n=1 Tax=unclassified Microbacterium TaxID=2609290 RepID=UPI000EA95618|nr:MULTISPECIES: helix-turn-helix domain-containing protein [unclassified Microbacterium]MBT2484400.1 helix-turn-helix domain-containing protein [Microbacterium sp. ISL-108]RKN67311.1 MarR family transcriptional regulator [Microbacterium sp. CGR2]